MNCLTVPANARQYAPPVLFLALLLTIAMALSACGGSAAESTSPGGIIENVPAEVPDVKESEAEVSRDFHAVELLTWRIDDRPPEEAAFSSISSAGQYTCGVKTDGSIACWGHVPEWNDDVCNRLFPGSDCPALLPLPQDKFSSISIDYEYGCGVKTDGNIACWGRESRHAKGLFANVPEGQFISVSLSATYACGLAIDGTVHCWKGSAAYSPKIFVRSHPICESSEEDNFTCWGYDLYSFDRTWVSFSADQGCGVDNEGYLHCWSSAGTPPFRYIHRAKGYAENDICAGTDTTEVVCWQSGFGGSRPESNLTLVERQNNNTCVLTAGGKATCSGSGFGFDEGGWSPEGTYTSFGMSNTHFCGIQTDGSVACSSNNPQATLDPAPEGVYQSVSGGQSHFCGVRADGSIACWSD